MGAPYKLPFKAKCGSVITNTHLFTTCHHRPRTQPRTVRFATQKVYTLSSRRPRNRMKHNARKYAKPPREAFKRRSQRVRTPSLNKLCLHHSKILSFCSSSFPLPFPKPVTENNLLRYPHLVFLLRPLLPPGANDSAYEILFPSPIITRSRGCCFSSSSPSPAHAA